MPEPNPTETDLFALTEAESQVLFEYDRAILDIQGQIKGAIRMMLINRGLDGTYKVVNGRLVEQK